MTNNNKKERGKLSQYFMPRQKEPNVLLSIVVTTVKLFLIFFLVLGFAGFGALLGVAKAYVDGTPTLDVGRISDQSLTSFIYDMNGDMMTEYRGLEYRIWAPLDEIPKVLQNALLATEDVRFYVHDGLDYKRLMGAFVNNLRSESVQGGSTLTQQLIKLTILSPEVTYKRKIQEAFLALQLEKEYSKEEILEAYLNTIYLGSGNYGVKAAAMNYYGKELEDLNLRESAVLVGSIQNPYRYDPRLNLYSRGRPDITLNRANLVLKLMYENGSITKAAYDNALFDIPEDGDIVLVYDDFHLLEASSHQKLYEMPYFVEYVISDLIEGLMKANGWEGKEGQQAAQNLIHTGGLHIHTTVDPQVQKAVEDAVYNFNTYPKTADPKDNVLRERKGERILDIPQPQAAAVVLDHRTGELRAIVGGRMDPLERFWQNRASLPWAPGSSIKPLAVYAPFIEAGYPGGIIIEDIPVSIPGWVDADERGYPFNYNSKTFNGPTSVRKAVTSSYNVSSARVLLERVGPEYSMNKLKELGITEPRYIETRLPSNLSLGSDPINMIEITAAYGTLANKGVYRQPISVTRVVDKDGNEIINNTNQTQLTVFKESTSFIISDWLTNAVTGGTGTNANFANMTIAGKTGTNNDHRGVFFAGYTPYYTATVVIAPDRHSISLARGTTGGSHAAPLWKRFMEPIHEGLDNIPFFDSVPEDVERVTVCAISGQLPSSMCASLVTEYFPKNAIPQETCDLHQEQVICKYSGKLPSPFCPDDHLTNRSIVVIPQDSVYQQLSDEELAKYIPGAFRNPVYSNTFDYYNPDQRDAFCPLHTAEWSEGENQRAQLSYQASLLIEQIKVNMQMYTDLLSNEQKDKLNNAIVLLEATLLSGLVSPPAEGEPYYTEVQKFDPSAVRAGMDQLRNTYQKVFDDLYNSPIDDNYNEANHGNGRNRRNDG